MVITWLWWSRRSRIAVPPRDRRTFGDAPTLDRRVAQVRVVDPHHPLYGKCFPISDRRSGRGPRLIVIRLPDGRERGISRSATAPTSASDDLAAAAPSRQVHISVRTLLPLANHVRAVLASRHADLEGSGGRDLDQMAAKQAGDAATPVAAPLSRDTASAGAVGGTARATPALAARPLRGGSSC
jgi:hypothetical protein